MGDNKALEIGLAKKMRTLAVKLSIDEKVLAPSESLDLSDKQKMFKTDMLAELEEFVATPPLDWMPTPNSTPNSPAA